MSRMNLDPLLTFPDGSLLVISTHCSEERERSCTLYTAILSPDDQVAFRIVSSHLDASTCLGAQEHAYDYALRLFPRATELIKRPPYVIWHGPLRQDPYQKRGRCQRGAAQEGNSFATRPLMIE